MKLIAIVGSHRKHGRSSRIAEIAIEGARKAQPDLSVSIYALADYQIESCRACDKCSEQPHRCVIQEDDFAFLFEAMASADFILFVCPHYTPIPSKMAALLERMEAVCFNSCQKDSEYVPPVRGKRCAIITLRGAGKAVFSRPERNLVIDSINNAVWCGNFVGIRVVSAADLGAEDPEAEEIGEGIRRLGEELVSIRAD